VFPVFSAVPTKKKKMSSKPRILSAMIYFFNAFKNVGYTSGLIYKPWFMGLLFLKSEQTGKVVF